MKRTPGALLAIVLGLAGCQLASAPFGQGAPEACGFPDGAALSYAGRSTTAALGVQEVVGDPLSHDPADIYITRDKFDQGTCTGASSAPSSSTSPRSSKSPSILLTAGGSPRSRCRLCLQPPCRRA